MRSVIKCFMSQSISPDNITSRNYTFKYLIICHLYIRRVVNLINSYKFDTNNPNLNLLDFVLEK